MAVTYIITIILWFLLFLSSHIILARPVTNSSLRSVEKQHDSQPCKLFSPTVDCHVPVLDNNIDFRVCTGRIISLTITCDTVMPSRLTDGFFEPLGHSLTYIDIYDCYFVNISRNAFRGLKTLKHLGITGGSKSYIDRCSEQPLNVSTTIQQPQLELALHPATFMCNHESLVLPNGIFLELESLHRLSLKGMRLNSSVWHELENLSNLTYLSLTNNDITTIDINTISKLKKLKELNLARNYIQTILNGTFESLSLLWWLDLSRNRISFLERGTFKALSHLKSLYLSQNCIKTIENGTFIGMIELSKLDLSRNRISFLERGTFKALSHLKSLYLSQNCIETIENGTFIGMIELSKLDLSRNEIETVSQYALSQLTILEYLDLSNNYIGTLPVFPSSLTTLKLSNNKIAELSSSSFAGVSGLTSLYLASNGLVQLPEDVFRTSYQLQTLDLSFNHIVQIPPLPRSLRTLDLSKNNIVDLSNSSFVGLFYLRSLNLSFNHIVQIPPLPGSLWTLDLSKNNIVDLSKSSSLPGSLRTLDLSNNNIADLRNSSFGELSYLSELNLGYNSLIQLPEDVFRTNYKLQRLDLSFNHIAQIPSLPRSLRALTLRDNNIVNISNSPFWGVSELSKLDLSQNKIRECTLNDMQNTMGNLNLSSNELSIISFNLTPSLSYLDLRNNNLVSVTISSLKEYRYAHGSGDIYLAGNRDPFQCVCNLEVQNKDSPFTYDNRNNAQYRIRNLTSLKCSSVNSLGEGGITEISAGTFMCNTSCHSNCTCYRWHYIGDINIVNCLNAGLTSVPVNISDSCNILDLSGNDLQLLRPGNFDGLSQLVELYLSSCSIIEINEGTFKGLSNLRKIDLSKNNISRMNLGILKGLNMIVFLNLSLNGITFVKGHTFESLSNLKNLDLSRNKLKVLSVSDIDRISALKYLRLSNNPWSCDCTFLENFMVFATKNSVQDKNNITCLTMNKTKHHITQIFMKDLCPYMPEAAATKDTTAVTVGSCVGVFVITVISLIVLFKKRKLLKVYCFVHFGRLFGCLRNNEEDRQYDAFVSFSHWDDTFIIRELMPRLEGPRPGQQGYRLCVHFRDFPVGASIAETILDVVDNSRRVIMVISDNFLRSEWCHFEFQAAHYQLLREKQYRIIMVLLHDINTDLLDNLLRMFLSTRTYVKYGDPLFWSKIEYAMPKRKPAADDNWNADNIDVQEDNLPAVMDEDTEDDVQLIT